MVTCDAALCGLSKAAIARVLDALTFAVANAVAVALEHHHVRLHLDSLVHHINKYSHSHSFPFTLHSQSHLYSCTIVLHLNAGSCCWATRMRSCACGLLWMRGASSTMRRRRGLRRRRSRPSILPPRVRALFPPWFLVVHRALLSHIEVTWHASTERAALAVVWATRDGLPCCEFLHLLYGSSDPVPHAEGRVHGMPMTRSLQN